MSSTRRPGNTYDPHPTPAWCVRRFLEAAYPRLSTNGPWVEPCAGDGAIVRAVSAFPGLDVEWRAVELRPYEEVGSRLLDSVRHCRRGGTVLHADVFSPAAADLLAGEVSDPHPSLVITNPPFALAEKVVRLFRQQWCLPTALLLPLNWLGGGRRVDLWRDVGVPDLYVLPDRTSFTPDGKTDSLYYAWMFWPDLDDERDDRVGRWQHLAPTPAAERRADREAQFGSVAHRADCECLPCITVSYAEDAGDLDDPADVEEPGR
jgi:hypothetical protein